MSPTPRKPKKKTHKNVPTGKESNKAQNPHFGDPTAEITRRPKKKATDLISVPTEDYRHVTKIRFGAFHPQEHFSKAALALIPVDEDY